ncbi:MAG: hypothetical protein M5U12_19230 [Verrucomicrobia bacterium]|nr:hypothetical protein [Verrucomicrobiota bacterium]
MPDPVVDAESPGSEQALDALLSQPTPALIEFIRSVSSPLLILGAGGKMGPSLAWLAHRAAVAAGHRLEVIGTSRFAQPEKRAWFEERGIRTAVCEVFDADSLARLPDAADVLCLVGAQVWHGGEPGRDVGDEHADTGAGVRAVSPGADRGAVDRQRLSAQ